MIGDNRYLVFNNNLTAMLNLHGKILSVSRLNMTPTTPTDIFGKPTDINSVTSTFNATVLITNQYVDEQPTLIGGKPKEILKFIVTAGQMKENDDFTYDSHSFMVKYVTKIPMAGQELESCMASREVAV